MLGRIRHELVDKEAEWNCLVGRNHEVTERTAYLVAQSGFLKLAAKLASEVGNIDETNLGAAPQVVVDLGDRGDAGGGVLEGIFHFRGLRAAGLDAKKSDHRRQTVFDAVAHLARQHGLVLQGFLELGVGLLPLDGDAE
jgi:hypothetical protein